jgi:hypothetical protein
MNTVEMPARLAGNLVMFIRQNKGKLAKEVADRLINSKSLTDGEVWGEVCFCRQSPSTGDRMAKEACGARSAERH